MSYTSILGKEQSGFSLIELLAAMAILCIGLLALFSTFGTTIFANAYAAQRTDAVRVAQEKMEAVKGMYFDDVVSQTGQLERNGIIYTYHILVSERETDKYLKDVTITVTWVFHRPSGDSEEQVQVATALVRR